MGMPFVSCKYYSATKGRMTIPILFTYVQFYVWITLEIGGRVIGEQEIDYPYLLRGFKNICF